MFKEMITTEEDLRALLGVPSELVKNKVIPFLDAHIRGFISQSPFLLMATADGRGNCDVSPRGDHAGFVHVVDDTHLIIPELPGNRRLDSLTNILSNPRIGLMFMIPGLEETLRVNGTACVLRDQEMLKQMASHGRVPVVGIGVTVDECFVHCAKAFKRSQLWESGTWPDRAQLPNMAKTLADHAKLPGMDERQVAAALAESYSKRLY